jgi:hypothetical protein
MLHMAKAPQQLDPRALGSTVAHVLYTLKELSVNEPDLPLSTKGLQVIPTRAGYSSSSSQGATWPPKQQQQHQGRQQLVLAAPFELFDPTMAVLKVGPGAHAAHCFQAAVTGHAMPALQCHVVAVQVNVCCKLTCKCLACS